MIFSLLFCFQYQRFQFQDEMDRRKAKQQQQQNYINKTMSENDAIKKTTESFL